MKIDKHNIKTILCWGFLFFVFITGCNHKQKEIQMLYPVKAKFKLRDSIFVRAPLSTILVHNGFIFIGDRSNQRILKLDLLLNLKNIFGRKGKGPGEFTFVGAMTTNHDSLYIFDFRAMRINVYSFDGNFIRTFKAPHEVRYSRIVCAHNKLYMSTFGLYGHRSSIFVTDLHGHLIRYFEKDLSTSNPKINHSNRLLFVTPNAKEIIAVSETVPYIERYYIERYSTKEEFLGSYNLQQIHFLDPLWRSYNKEKSQNTPRLQHIIISDAYLDGNTLYIACAGWHGRDHYTYIIKFTVNENSIKPGTVFKIGRLSGHRYMDLYEDITVTGHALIAFDSYTQGIAMFDLSKLN